MLAYLCVGSGTGFSQTAPATYPYLSAIHDSLSTPVRMAIDAADNIYVTDAVRHQVIKYNSNGVYLTRYTTVSEPVSVAISGNGRIYIGDRLTGKVFKLNPNGTTVEFFNGTAFPCSMTCGPDGLLYISDSRLQRVIVVDPSGNLVRNIGVGTLLCPTGVTYDRKNNRLLIAEHGGLGTGFSPVVNVRIYTPTGTLISTFGSNGNTDGKFYRVQGLAVGRCGEIYVTEPFQGYINVFAENTTFATHFGNYGDSTSQLRVPLDIAINSADKIFVTAENNGWIDVFNLEYVLPTSDISCGDQTICAGSSAVIPVRFTGTAPWTFTYTSDGVNSTTLTGIHENPYLLNVTSAGNYRVTAVSDSLHAGTCFSGHSVITINTQAPTATLSSGNASVCPGQQAYLTVSLTGMSPWNLSVTRNGAPFTTFTELTTNPYTFSVSDSGTYAIASVTGPGCPGQVTGGPVIVTSYAKPAVSLQAGTIFSCIGTPAPIPFNFSGTAPWSLTLMHNGVELPRIDDITANPFLLSVSDSGIYRVKSFQDRFCTGTVSGDSVQVSFRTLPTATLLTSTATACPGDTALIIVGLTGTSPWNVHYTIDGVPMPAIEGIQANPLLINATVAGTYALTSVSDQFCSGTVDPSITVMMQNPLPVVSLASPQSLCPGDSLALDPGAFLFYSWSDLSSERVLNVHAPGTYSVTVSDYNGCRNSASAIVDGLPAPTATFAGGSVSLCQGETADLPVSLTGTSPWTLTYTISNGALRTVAGILQNPYFLNAWENGEYRITGVTDAVCKSGLQTGSTTVTVHPKPGYNFPAGNGSYCPGTITSIPVNLSGTPPWDVTYTIDGIQQATVSGILSTPWFIPVATPGTYAITNLTDAYCHGERYTGSVTMTQLPAPVADLGPDLNLIAGQVLTLSPGQNFASYTWSDGTTGSTLSVTTGDTYSVTATDYNGCTAYDAVSVNVIVPVNQTIENQTVEAISCFNAVGTLTIAGNGNYFTVVPGGSVTLIAGHAIQCLPDTRVDSGGYLHGYITLNNTFCGGVIPGSEPMVSVAATPEPVQPSFLPPSGALPQPLDGVLKLFPNPSTGMITIEINNPAKLDLHIAITDMAGRQIFSKRVTDFFQRSTADLTAFPAGFYIVYLHAGQLINTTKLVLTE